MAEEVEEDPESALRAVEMQRLRRMPIEQMRDIAHLDMLGEYGSKVSKLVTRLFACTSLTYL